MEVQTRTTADRRNPTTRTPQQLWYVLWGTTVRLLDHYQGCLALPGNNPVAGTRVQVYQCTGAANQQWVLDLTNGAITWG